MNNETVNDRKIKSNQPQDESEEDFSLIDQVLFFFLLLFFFS
jgi:hypothetical protein